MQGDVKVSSEPHPEFVFKSSKRYESLAGAAELVQVARDLQVLPSLIYHGGGYIRHWYPWCGLNRQEERSCHRKVPQWRRWGRDCSASFWLFLPCNINPFCESFQSRRTMQHQDCSSCACVLQCLTCNLQRDVQATQRRQQPDVSELLLYAVVIAVGSRTLQKAKDFIQETNSDSAKPYGSYEEVLEDGNVHGVYIPLPTALHLEWVKEAAEKGKHILLEKPIALVSNSSTTGTYVHACTCFICFLAGMVRSKTIIL